MTPSAHRDKRNKEMNKGVRSQPDIQWIRMPEEPANTMNKIHKIPITFYQCQKQPEACQLIDKSALKTCVLLKTL